MATYDIFITCKSEDYSYAEEIYDFLSNNGLKVFLASKELRKLGESEYRKAISNAMQQAYHLIIFASKPEYIDSTWVYYEWDMFVNAKLKGYKPGNIITILKDVKTNEINMDLWKYESLEYDSFQNSILEYVETQQSRKRKLQKQLQEENEKKRESIKAEFIHLAEDYQKKKMALSIDLTRIRSFLGDMSINELTCPICGNTCTLNDDYCPKCGWSISCIGAIEETRYLDKTDTHQINRYRTLYKQACNKNDIGTIAPLNRKIRELEDALVKKDKELQDLSIHHHGVEKCIATVRNGLSMGTIAMSQLIPTQNNPKKWFKIFDNKAQLWICVLFAVVSCISLFVSFTHFPSDFELFGFAICSASLLFLALLSSKVTKKFLIVSMTIVVLLCALIEYILCSSFELFPWILIVGGLFAYISLALFGNFSNSNNISTENKRWGNVILIVFSCLTVGYVGVIFWIINLLNKSLWNWSKNNRAKLWIINIILIIIQFTIFIGFVYNPKNCYSYDNDLYNYESTYDVDTLYVEEVDTLYVEEYVDSVEVNEY